jgi:hypothetical protein
MAKLRGVLLLLFWFPFGTAAADTLEFGTQAIEFNANGVQEDDNSLQFHLMKIDLLEDEDRILEWRDASREASELFPEDEAVLRRLARVSDIFANQGGEAYERWAAAMERAGRPATEIQSALERGIIVALRDGERETADRLSEKLARFGSTSLRSVKVSVPARSTVVVPGGIQGLAAAVEIDLTIPPSSFVVEYGRAILQGAALGTPDREKFKNRVRLYLQTVQSLKTLGRETNNGTEISIDIQTNQGFDRGQKILNLLGWRIVRVKNNVLLEIGSDEDAAVRQTFASTLGVDELSMKNRLEDGQTVTFKILDERASVIFDEPYWLNTILTQPRPRRSLLEEMLENPQVTLLYMGLASMNDETQRAVVHSFDSAELLKQSQRLSFYGSSIAIEDGGIVLPGGDQAVGAWSKLVEVSPDSRGEFIKNLVRKDKDKLLAYYHSLAVLPQDHQRFFTRTPQRLSAFYKVFPFEDEANLGRNFFYRREDTFARMARELPLDQDGKIVFPGSERVWTIAKGGSQNITEVQKLTKQIRRASSPDAEDEILLSMLDQKNEVAGRKVSQIENFLAVARIDAHRKQPMDEVMALTLSQMYAKYRAIFPYFAALSSLNGDHVTTFARAAERIEKFDQGEMNTVLGEFHSLIQLIILLKETGKLPDEKCAQLFSFVAGKFAGAETTVDFTRATFDSAENILGAAGRPRTEDADAFLLRAFSGEAAPQEFWFDGALRSVDLSLKNKKRISEVLRLQSISSLEALLRTYRAARSLALAPEATALAEIELNAPKLLEVTEAPEDKLSYKLRRQVGVARPEEVMRTIGKLKSEFSMEQPSKEIPKLAAKLTEELNPFLRTTLVGWIYAFYFSPQDLAIAGDRYLVRRHMFYDRVRRQYWVETRSTTDVESTGSYLSGGFTQMASAVAYMAKTKVEVDDSITTNRMEDAVVTAGLAAVRSVPWTQVAERSMHLTALKLRLGREFVVRSAFDAELRKELGRVTIGLLGLRRRFDLLQALGDSDVSEALSQLSNADFFFLADALSTSPLSKRAHSILADAIARETVAVQPNQVDYFGGMHIGTDGCAQPHFTRPAPYEEYENLLFVDPLAERLSDILLYAADDADRLGLPVQGLALLAESVVQQFSMHLKMSHSTDWQSAIEAMRSIDLAPLIPVLDRN